MIYFQYLEDQLNYYVWSGWVVRWGDSFDYFAYRELFAGYTHPLASNQPLLWYILKILGYRYGEYAYFIFTIVSFVISVFILSHISKVYKLRNSYYLLFVIYNPFYLIHFFRHPEFNALTLTLTFYALLLLINTTKYGLMIFLIFLVSILSNYLGIFLILSASLTLFILRVRRIHLLKSLILLVVLLAIILNSHIIKFFTKDTVDRSDITYHRSYSDFFLFSVRPWYLFMPSLENPIFGKITSITLTFLNSKDYFLLDDYFKAEHQGNFFGVSFLVLHVLLFVQLIFSKLAANNANSLNDTGCNTKERGIRVYILVFVLFLFMLPPYFTLSGVKFYTPGVLFSDFLTIFRVTSRMSIVLFYLLLIQLTNYKNSTRLLAVLLKLVFFLLIFEFYTPIKLKLYNDFPIGLSTTLVGKRVAVLEQSLVNKFFINSFKNGFYLVNPSGFANKNFSSKEFLETSFSKPLSNSLCDYVISTKKGNIHDAGLMTNTYQIGLFSSELLVSKCRST